MLSESIYAERSARFTGLHASEAAKVDLVGLALARAVILHDTVACTLRAVATGFTAVGVHAHAVAMTGHAPLTPVAALGFALRLGFGLRNAGSRFFVVETAAGEALCTALGRCAALTCRAGAFARVGWCSAGLVLVLALV